jgi:hypothetical protein
MLPEKYILNVAIADATLLKCDAFIFMNAALTERW